MDSSNHNQQPENQSNEFDSIEKVSAAPNDAAPTENNHGAAPSDEAKTEPAKPNFIPDGTYSYSKAKGNIPKEENTAADVFQNGAANINIADYQPPKKEKRGKKSVGIGTVIVAALLAAIIGAGAGVGGYFTAAKYLTENTSIGNTATNTTNTTITVNESANSTVEAVAKKAGSSIIGIRTTAAVTNFFGGSSEATEEGSGIIYTADGYIITNYHVIESAVESSKSKVEVFLPSDPKTAINATVIGYNINSDLAVVKIDKTGLTAIEFANSDEIKVGQYAIAIGNPGGLEFMGSVSYGVISGLNRSLSADSDSDLTLIQTDAAINPGNSGGALVNTEGKLIGVNSVKLVSESYEGMGFAIPANDVKRICKQIIEKQHNPTPYVGIQISQNYSQSTLEQLGYPAGAVVISVINHGPAAESGIQRGDIITEFNSIEIKNYSDFDKALEKCKVGDTVTVKIYRAGRFYSTSLTIKANNAQ